MACWFYMNRLFLILSPTSKLDFAKQEIYEIYLKRMAKKLVLENIPIEKCLHNKRYRITKAQIKKCLDSLHIFFTKPSLTNPDEILSIEGYGAALVKYLSKTVKEIGTIFAHLDH